MVNTINLQQLNYLNFFININKSNKMASIKTFKVEVEMEHYDVLSKRKKESGITLDFQLREAVKMYVEILNKKQNEKNSI